MTDPTMENKTPLTDDEEVSTILALRMIENPAEGPRIIRALERSLERIRAAEQAQKEAEEQLAAERQHRDGHLPDCAGVNEAEGRCGCGYFQGGAYRELLVCREALDGLVEAKIIKRHIEAGTSTEQATKWYAENKELLWERAERAIRGAEKIPFCPSCRRRADQATREVRDKTMRVSDMTYQEIGLKSQQVKRWVTLHSEKGYPYKSFAWCDMPRIDEKILQCSIYLYESKTDARLGAHSGGSGVLIGIPGADGTPAHIYAVTNGHVARGTNVIRVNTLDGSNDFIDAPTGLWTYSEDFDLAVFPLDLEGSKYQQLAISVQMFLTRDKVVTKGVGPGDDTFVVGRFVNHEGLQQNRPSVRFGTIAVMPDMQDGIKNEFVGKKVESYLVETHSISGYSGSPVFFHIAPLSQRPQSAESKNPLAWRGNWLLGIDWGHLLTYDPVLKKDKKGTPNIETEYMTQANTGMMCVAPAWQLLELLNLPELAAERYKVDMANSPAKPPSTALDGIASNSAGGDAILKTMLTSPPKPNVQHEKKKPTKKRV